MKWSHNTDRIILLAILKTHKFITIDYEAVAREIGGCTAATVYRQVIKLRKIAQNNNQKMGNKPIAYKKPRGGTKKGYSDDEEDIKDIKPMPHIQRKFKVEQPEAVMEQAVIKQEEGQETQVTFPSDEEMVIIL